MSVCSICGGTGLVRVLDAQGNWVSRACSCQEAERERRRLNAAEIPARYRDCTLDSFEIYHEADRSLGEALLTARRFVDEYPAGSAGGRGDIDSGPLIFGISPSGTGFSIAGSRVFGDRELFVRLTRTANLIGTPVSRGDRRLFVTGGPLGNAIMLAMLTAQPAPP